MSSRIITIVALAIAIGGSLLGFHIALRIPGDWERGDVLEVSVLVLLVVWFVCDRFDIGWWKDTK